MPILSTVLAKDFHHCGELFLGKVSANNPLYMTCCHCGYGLLEHPCRHTMPSGKNFSAA